MLIWYIAKENIFNRTIMAGRTIVHAFAMNDSAMVAWNVDSAVVLRC